MSTEITSLEDFQRASTEQQTRGEPITGDMLQYIHLRAVEAALTYIRDVPPEKQRASMLTVIIKFLKDNSVTADSIQARKDMLAKHTLEGEALPFKTTP
ncbi:MAG: hypothetical protein JWN94_1027 [Betaproteobacteria bacterium]|nr:hypothetical protein [Betaproteobacteria bacterium]